MLKLKLVEVGKHKIQVIKLIRLFTELGLKESKDLMDNAPSVLISYREDLKLNQIIKNFKAIGAKVEEIIEEKPVKKDDVVGSDDSSAVERPGSAKKVVKEYQKKSTTKSTFKQPKFSNKVNTPKKLKLKPAIFFAITIAIIKSFSTIYFGFYTFFFAIFFVAIGVAYFLRKYNINEDKKLGVPAFLITLLYFFSIVVIDWIIFSFLNQHLISLNIFSIIISMFTSLNILVLVAAGAAYFLAINKNVFKRFLPETQFNGKKEANIVENKNKKYHKEKKRF